MGLLHVQGPATGAAALLSRLSWSWEPWDFHLYVGILLLSAAQAGHTLRTSNRNGTPRSCFSPSLWAEIKASKVVDFHRDEEWDQSQR